MLNVLSNSNATKIRYQDEYHNEEETKDTSFLFSFFLITVVYSFPVMPKLIMF